jgi:uncharacterized membrane protein YgcG
MDDVSESLVAWFQGLSNEDRNLLIERWDTDREAAAGLAAEMAERSGMNCTSQSILSLVETLINEEDADIELTPEVIAAVSGGGKRRGGSSSSGGGKRGGGSGGGRWCSSDPDGPECPPVEVAGGN